jgi:hypothetical protein
MEDRGTFLITWGNSGVSPELLTWVVGIAQTHGAIESSGHLANGLSDY